MLLKFGESFIIFFEIIRELFKGEFLCCYEYYGDWNGLQRSSVENVAREGLACVVQIELEVRKFQKKFILN
jgi:guanylate kinase